MCSLGPGGKIIECDECKAEKSKAVSNSALGAGGARLELDISLMERCLQALYLEVPASIADDIMDRWKAVKTYLPNQ